MNRFVRGWPRVQDALSSAVLSGLMAGADWAARRPAPAPSRERLQRARIVAHRGAHGPGRVENTIAAFDAADRAGVWGLEFDVRFAGDATPVISHDADLRRVFGQSLAVSDFAAADLRRRAPSVPFLAEAIERYGGRRHLMIEIKADAVPRGRQADAFREAVKGLEPGRDWHLLALNPRLFAAFPWLPPETFALVAELQPRAFSRAALEGEFGALCGHFALLTPALRRRHLASGQTIGVGHVASPSCLRREVASGADWLFTNRAEAAQAWLNEDLSRPL